MTTRLSIHVGIVLLGIYQDLHIFEIEVNRHLAKTVGSERPPKLALPEFGQ